MARRQKNEEEWVPAFEAATQLIQRFGGLTRAQHALAIALREGLVRGAVEACELVQGHEDEVEEQEAPADELIGVPPLLWTHSGQWDADRLSWDWEAGDFEIESRDRGCHYLLHGLHFLQSELDQLEPTQAAFRDIMDVQPSLPSAPQKIDSRPRGPKPSLKWAAFTEAVLKLERNGELHVGKFDGPRELRQRLLRQADEAISERSIEPIVSAIFENMLEPVPLASKVAALIEAVMRADQDGLLVEGKLESASDLVRQLEDRVPPELTFEHAIVQAVAKHVFARLVVRKSPKKLT